MNTKYTIDPSEELLLEAASKGNLDAFNQLVLKYQDMAYRHARAVLGDSISAEDATQDSFIKAFQSIGAFRGGSFRGWLLKIVTNSAYDMLRHAQRHPNQPLFPEDENGDETKPTAWLVDPSAFVQMRVEQNERAKYIYHVLDELPALYLSVLTLIDLYECDYSEVAEALKIPMGTVKSRLARARLQVKNKLLENSDYFTGANRSSAISIV